MLSRYQTGPFATVVVALVGACIFASGLYEALWHHRINGWFSAVSSIGILLNFHRLFYRRED